MKPVKIFIIDDDPYFLKSAEIYFNKNHCENYQFFYYSNGEQALKEHYRNPDMVVVDYYLDSNQPDADNGLRIINGFHILLPGTQLILISGNIHSKLKHVSKELGYFECFEKNKLLFETLIKKFNSLMLAKEITLFQKLMTYFSSAIKIS